MKIQYSIKSKDKQFIKKIKNVLHDSRSWTYFYNNLELEYVPYSNNIHVNVIFNLFKNEEIVNHCGLDGLSCFDPNNNNIYINYENWARIPEAFYISCKGKCNLDDYRTYVINHEFGHYLGHGHLKKEEYENMIAPVMIQQTLGIGKCIPNVYPTIYDLKA